MNFKNPEPTCRSERIRAKIATVGIAVAAVSCCSALGGGVGDAVIQVLTSNESEITNGSAASTDNGTAFGDLAKGKKRNRIFTIQNNGGMTMVISVLEDFRVRILEMPGGNDGHLQFEVRDQPFFYQISPNSRFTFELQFCPNLAGEFGATVQILWKKQPNSMFFQTWTTEISGKSVDARPIEGKLNRLKRKLRKGRKISNPVRREMVVERFQKRTRKVAARLRMLCRTS